MLRRRRRPRGRSDARGPAAKQAPEGRQVPAAHGGHVAEEGAHGTRPPRRARGAWCRRDGPSASHALSIPSWARSVPSVTPGRSTESHGTHPGRAPCARAGSRTRAPRRRSARSGPQAHRSSRASKRCDQRQPAQARHRGSRADSTAAGSSMQRPQHLEAHRRSRGSPGATATHRSSSSAPSRPPVRSQLEVGHGRLGAGQHDQVGVSQAPPARSTQRTWTPGFDERAGRGR